MTPRGYTFDELIKEYGFTEAELKQGRSDFREMIYARGYADALEDAAMAIANEKFHLPDHESVEMVKAVRARYIAAIRALQRG